MTDVDPIEFDRQRPVGTRHLIDSSRATRQHIHAVVRTPNGNDYGKHLGSITCSIVPDPIVARFVARLVAWLLGDAGLTC